MKAYIVIKNICKMDALSFFDGNLPIIITKITLLLLLLIIIIIIIKLCNMAVTVI